MNVQRTDSASQTLMGTDLVKLLAKTVEGSLPRTQVSFAGQGRAAFRLRSILVHGGRFAAGSPLMRSGKLPGQAPDQDGDSSVPVSVNHQSLCVSRTRLRLAKNPVIPRSHIG